MTLLSFTFHIKSSLSRDERLASWCTKREKINKKIKRLKDEIAYVNDVISYIDDDIADGIKSIYTGKKTISQIGKKIGYSTKQMERKINEAIFEAVMFHDCE